MTTVDDKETFLSRWSRRKLEAKEDAPGGAPQAAEFAPDGAPQAGALPAGAPVLPQSKATEPLAPGTSEAITPEYREYFDPRVDETLRRTALKKLFSDPHFNTMDGLDTYIDDYSKPDPIPEAMLRQLNQAKDLFLFDDEKQASESAGNEISAAAGGTAPAVQVATGDTSTLPEPPPANAFGEAAGAATTAAVAPPREGSRNE